VMTVSLEGFQAFDGDAYSARKVLRFVAYLLTDVVEELAARRIGWLIEAATSLSSPRSASMQPNPRPFTTPLRRRETRLYDPFDWSRGFIEVAQSGGGTWRVPVMRINFTFDP